MLIKVADPHGRSNALEAYANKQPFYEPFMGGGLVTAMALPTVAFPGPVPALAITSGILAAWLFFACRLASPRMQARRKGHSLTAAKPQHSRFVRFRD